MLRSILCRQLVLRASILLALVSIVAVWQSEAVYGQSSQAVTTTVTATEQGAVASTVVASGRTPHHPSRVIVRFRNGRRDFLPGSGAARVLDAGRDLCLVWNPPGLAVAEAVRSYKANPNVMYVEPDYEVRTSEITPSDTRWAEQWDMTKIAAPLAWGTQTSASDVVVAIVDTGIDFTHPDLQLNLWNSGGTHGFTCINGSCAPGGQDDYGHGTHVAGTIGATTDNNLGIAGINWRVQMLSFKFLDYNGSGYTSDAIAAYYKILDLKNSGVNIRVTNNSWGGGNYSQALKEAMEDVEGAGIVNVCAAGNSGQNADATPMYPAAYANRGIVSVLATDINDTGAGFSNFGIASVDLAAPGVSTLSTVPSVICSLCDVSGYRALSGTSMATPHVSGVVAALLHRNPSLTAEEARDIILDPGSYDAMTDAKAQSTSSGGRLNFYKAITNPRLNEPEPLNTFPNLMMGSDIVAAGGSYVNLAATASDPDPGDDATLRWVWTKSTSAGSAWLFGWMANSLFPSPSGSGASFTAPTVARAVTMSYNASVADHRGGGSAGQEFVTVSATPGQIGPPTGWMSVSSTSAPPGSTITVTYQPTDPDKQGQPAWDLWVTGNGSVNGACCYTQSSTGITFNSAGVYRISVQAVDRALDLSAKQGAVVVIGGATGRPPIARATLDRIDGPVPLTVNIDMRTSSDEDGTIQSYYQDCGGGNLTPGSTASTATCAYDRPGIYWQLLQVVDDSGLMDVISTYVVATPASSGGTVPAPPANLTATPGEAKVTLTWSASADATSYRVKRALTSGGPYGQIAEVGFATTSYEDAGVWNCTTYYYVVSAVNASGESANSSQAQAMLWTVPPPPMDLSANAGTGVVTLAWTGNACAETYNLKRGTGSGSYDTLIPGVKAASYVDANVNNGTKYYYRVSASNSVGDGGYSPEVSATPVAAPTGLTSTAGDRQVFLQWTASLGAAGYNVKRSTRSGGPYTLIAALNATQTSHTDTGVTNGTTYYYVVSATTSPGESTNSTPVSATPQAASPAPTLQSLTLSASKVKGGTPITGTVTISGPAPGDILVVLSSSNPGVLTVPTTTTITKGNQSASFNIGTKPVTSNKNVKVMATYGSVSKQQSVVVTR